MKKIILFAIFLLLTLNKQSQADITMENGYISLSFHDSTYALKRITDMSAGSNIYFEDRESPIWQVTFLDTQNDSVETSDLYTRSSFEFDAEKSFIIQNTEDGQLLFLNWSGIEFFPGDTLSVKATIFLPAGENKSVWDISVLNSSTRYATFSVDYPFNAIKPLNGDRENDMLLFPSQSGSLFEDPIGNARLSINNGSDLTGLGGNNVYPGMTGMQFAYLYDKDSERGLYFSTDDTCGFVRRYGFYGRESQNFIYYLIRHYPENHHQITSTYQLPYHLTIETFSGDWYDAAKYYRQWAVQQPWCQPGKLYQRADFNREVGESAFILIINAVEMGGETQLILNRMQEQKYYFDDPRLLTHLRNWYWSFFLANGYPRPGVQALVHAMTSAGFRVAPYTSTHAWKPQFYPDPIAEAGVARDINRNILYLSRWDSYIMCAGSPTWQDFYPRRISEMVAQLGTTDIYLDNYPSHRFCYVQNHGHTLGGGAHWSRGFKTFLSKIRNENPGSLMGNEGKYEQLIPYLDGFYSPLWTGAGGPAQNDRPFCMPGAFPVPLVQCVYHDYIIPFGSSSGYWEEYFPGQYAFEQAYAFVNGNALEIKIDSTSISHYQPDKVDDWKFNRQMMKTFAHAKKYLRYGEWMRPPEMIVPTTTIHFNFSYPIYEYIEQPKILSGCFKAADETLGLVFANYTEENVSSSFSINLENYGIISNDYSVNIIDTTGFHFYEQFNGSTYGNQLSLAAKSVILFQIVTSTAISEDRGNSISRYQLIQNYPNPFNLNCTIQFSLPKKERVTLKIFDVLGREIAVLVDKKLDAGNHSIHYQAKELQSGLYFYRLHSGDFILTKKLIVLK